MKGDLALRNIHHPHRSLPLRQSETAAQGEAFGGVCARLCTYGLRGHGERQRHHGADGREQPRRCQLGSRSCSPGLCPQVHETHSGTVTSEAFLCEQTASETDS